MVDPEKYDVVLCRDDVPDMSSRCYGSSRLFFGVKLNWCFLESGHACFLCSEDDHDA